MTNAASSESKPSIITIPLGAWQTNCHVVHVPDAAGPDEARHAAWIVDCGDEPEPLFAEVDRRGLRPQAIVLTHCHVDHIAGIDKALARYGPIPILCHEAEAAWNAEPLLNLSAYAPREVRVTPPTRFVRDGDILTWNGTRWVVLHVPGHSPGSVAYVHLPSRQAIVGDTLFAGSIGRFDFPTSDRAALKRSVLETLMSLPDDLVIHPGHGPATQIGRERQTNPYVRSPSSW